MIVYPAIDLRAGTCVRLMHGRFDQVTEYDESPGDGWPASSRDGATWVHIVDLDGAQAGHAVQHTLIGELASSFDVPSSRAAACAPTRTSSTCCARACRASSSARWR
jgi:phosphoribosylformimino-5-aminoimidazole carboxamide ribotide isomerase